MPPDLPSEILLHICTLALQHDIFCALRLVNRQFNTSITTHADFLFRTLAQLYDIESSILALYGTCANQVAGEYSTPTSVTKLLQFHADISRAVLITAELQNRYCLSLPATYTNPPNPIPGSINALLMLSCLSKTLRYSFADPSTDSSNSVTVLTTAEPKGSLIHAKLPVTFLRLVDTELSLSYMESLIPTVDLCATSLAEAGHKPVLWQCSEAEGTIEHWQKTSLQQRVLVEHVLWRGLHWLTMMRRHGHSQSSVQDSNGDTLARATQRRHLWSGSHGDAARLGAHGLARYLWRERQRKHAMSAERQNLGVDQGSALVWQSSGDI